ncbi:hypothetical protein [Psychromonas sp. Urea-02u-13]|uniref:hypothetical protein n=1 Tax=Psychromonas sp. Urea-02u-13 TaxID=2058326 RepID=UPI000C31DD4B|nr:hypothetical protein [Psychromonas sp. Urea-02u-13]PKG37591.1 hypothetical protein CXF74_18055 [Psychromonas sp. Urea-02u-13]
MTEYIMLAIIMVFMYFVLIRNKSTPKTDWESLPSLTEYQKTKKSSSEQGKLCCQHCGHHETIERSLNSEKENPTKNKFYHACTCCKVVLWRSQRQ